jgi:hypothetical protein
VRFEVVASVAHIDEKARHGCRAFQSKLLDYRLLFGEFRQRLGELTIGSRQRFPKSELTAWRRHFLFLIGGGG